MAAARKAAKEESMSADLLIAVFLFVGAFLVGYFHGVSSTLRHRREQGGY